MSIWYELKFIFRKYVNKYVIFKFVFKTNLHHCDIFHAISAFARCIGFQGKMLKPWKNSLDF